MPSQSVFVYKNKKLSTKITPDEVKRHIQTVTTTLNAEPYREWARTVPQSLWETETKHFGQNHTAVKLLDIVRDSVSVVENVRGHLLYKKIDSFTSFTYIVSGTNIQESITCLSTLPLYWHMIVMGHISGNTDDQYGTTIQYVTWNNPKTHVDIQCTPLLSPDNDISDADDIINKGIEEQKEIDGRARQQALYAKTALQRYMASIEIPQNTRQHWAYVCTGSDEQKAGELVRKYLITKQGWKSARYIDVARES